MELWLHFYDEIHPRPADAILNMRHHLLPDWVVEDEIHAYSVGEGCLLDAAGEPRGCYLTINDESEQQNAMQYVGMNEWVVVDCGDWKMIPIENLVAAADSSGTKIAAVINEKSQLQGATFALQMGVDALVLPDDDEIWAAAQKLAAERLAQTSGASESSAIVIPASVETTLEVLSVEPGGLGDRVCVDLVQMLDVGEGLLVGSSSSMMALVHGETLPSDFVPARPFRVNAGPVHSYVMMGNGKTKYLSELVAGDEVLVASKESSRIVAVGRLKIEPRPLLLVRLLGENGESGQLFLQQAETVRLLSNLEKAVSITHLEAGMEILGISGSDGRHLGQTIRSSVEER